MNVQKLPTQRIVTTVTAATIILMGLTLMIQFGYMLVRAVSDLPQNASPAEQQARFDAEISQMNREISQGAQNFTIVYMIAWGLAVPITFAASYWAARGAENPRMASMTGGAVAVGIVSTYGVACVLCSSGTNSGLFMVALGFDGLLFASGVLGGRLAARGLNKPRRRPQSAPAPTWTPPAMPNGTEIYFNMGVVAAVGGRRDEARKHFGTVIQMAPYHIGAWLQLANLADTPEEAWDYVQQARAVNPNDPAVIEAVNVIWPRIKAKQAPESPPDEPAV
jgi:hypothetical protein